MQTKSSSDEQGSINALWIAANGAKADHIDELEQMLRVWGAANDVKSERIRELEIENEFMREELEALRAELSAPSRRPRLVRAA